MKDEKVNQQIASQIVEKYCIEANKEEAEFLIIKALEEKERVIKGREKYLKMIPFRPQ